MRVPPANAPPTDAPGVIVFPPLLFGGTLVLGLLLHLLAPLPLRLPSLPPRLVGAALVIGSGVLARWAERTMRRAGTTARPDLPTTALVTSGPFRHSRNPLYLASTALCAGVAFLVPAARGRSSSSCRRSSCSGGG